VTLPAVILDDRNFQDLVDEARTRITLSCPEWTEHNVSDPGVTLIELFAWMTDQLLYRVNRIPDKLHVALLELLGVRLDPPSCATTDLRFRLAEPGEEDVAIPAIETEVGTPRTATEPSVVFQVQTDALIPAARPTAFAASRGAEAREVGVDKGWARPTGKDRQAFSSTPKAGDFVALAFDVPLSNLVIEIEMEGTQARGAGVDPEDPPLIWEISAPGGEWGECEVLRDETGGFNYGSGRIELQAPADSGPVAIAGTRAHWLRCRLVETSRSGKDAGYTHSPEIHAITAVPVGVLAPAAHATAVTKEPLGISDGTPGQRLRLLHAPVLPLGSGEALEVQDPDTGAWTVWEARDAFAESGPNDLHFVLDPATGEIEFGPTVRQPDGGWTAYGETPRKGAALRFSRYRHGGGREGNVAAGTLIVLKKAIPGVATVVNPRAAIGGADVEDLDAARARAALEVRSRHRAVTASDFEFLAGEASRQVARTRCMPAEDGTVARVHVLRGVSPADRLLERAELVPDQALLEVVAEHLDGRRLLGASVDVVPVPLRGVSVVVNLEADPSANLQRVEEDVLHALYTFLNPLVGGSLEGPWTGWPFGRTLNQGELYGIVHAVPGVSGVKVLRVYETDLETGKQDAKPAGSHLEIEPQELIASATHIVKASHPTR